MKRRRIDSSSIAETAAAPGNGAAGAKTDSPVTGAFRFQGQTSWQMSHPNCQPATPGVSRGLDVAAVLDREVADTQRRASRT